MALRHALKDEDERARERLVSKRLLARDRARAGADVGEWRTMLSQGKPTDMLQGLAVLVME